MCVCRASTESKQVNVEVKIKNNIRTEAAYNERSDRDGAHCLCVCVCLCAVFQKKKPKYCLERGIKTCDSNKIIKKKKPAASLVLPAMDSCAQESIPDWEDAIKYAVHNRDPKRLQWLVVNN